MSTEFRLKDRDLQDYVKTTQQDILELNKEIINMSIDIKEKNNIIKMLLSENETLRAVKEEAIDITKSDIFVAYMCSYYKTSIKSAKPFVKQLLSYFLRNEFKMKLVDISLLLNYWDHTTVIYNIKSVNNALNTQKDYLRDVLIHRQWLRKLNEIK